MHIYPLIHSKEGKKLSKRDGAATVEDYQKIGILPESLRNYLLKTWMVLQRQGNFLFGRKYQAF